VDFAAFNLPPADDVVTRDYRFSFAGFSNDVGRIWLSLTILRAPTASRSFSTGRVTASAYRTRPHSAPTLEFLHPQDLQVIFGPRRHYSAPVNIWTLPLTDCESISINTTLEFGAGVSGVVFEWSTFNAWNPLVRRFACYGYSAVSAFLLGALATTFERRTEQLGTFISLFLYGLSTLALSGPSAFCQFFEKAMLGFLRAYLFYLVSFIANKHRNFITAIGFFLIVIAFLFDLVCCWDTWNGSLDIVHGHDIAMHCVLVAVLCSMIAAMHFFAEDALAFVSYACLLALSLIGTVLTLDARIIYPHIEHWLEPNLAFSGLHAIIVSVLFYLHQGTAMRDGADRLTEASSDFSLL
jgi:hypothetical protein